MSQTTTPQRAPLQTLLPEILSRIFFLCLFDSEEENTSGIPLLLENGNPVKFAYVCKHWHQVVQESPELWSRFGVRGWDEDEDEDGSGDGEDEESEGDGEGEDETHDELEEEEARREERREARQEDRLREWDEQTSNIMDQFLQRSKNTDLHICMQDGTLINGDLKVATRLISAAARWRTLDVVVHMKALQHVLDAIESGTPRLKTLVMDVQLDSDLDYVVLDDESEIPLTTLALENAPQLERLRLSGHVPLLRAVDQTQASLDNIRYLTLKNDDYTDFADIFTWLVYCPLIEELELEPHDDNGGPEPNISEVLKGLELVTLPRLQKLHLSTCGKVRYHARFTRLFLSRIVAPNLTSLYLFPNLAFVWFDPDPANGLLAGMSRNDAGEDEESRVARQYEALFSFASITSSLSTFLQRSIPPSPSSTIPLQTLTLQAPCVPLPDITSMLALLPDLQTLLITCGNGGFWNFRAVRGHRTKELNAFFEALIWSSSDNTLANRFCRHLKKITILDAPDVDEDIFLRFIRSRRFWSNPNASSEDLPSAELEAVVLRVSKESTLDQLPHHPDMAALIEKGFQFTVNVR